MNSEVVSIYKNIIHFMLMDQSLKRTSIHFFEMALEDASELSLHISLDAQGGKFTCINFSREYPELNMEAGVDDQCARWEFEPDYYQFVDELVAYRTESCFIVPEFMHKPHSIVVKHGSDEINEIIEFMKIRLNMALL